MEPPGKVLEMRIADLSVLNLIRQWRDGASQAGQRDTAGWSGFTIAGGAYLLWLNKHFMPPSGPVLRVQE